MKKEDSQVKRVEEALGRVRSQPAIDLADLATLTDVHVSTVQRAAARGDLPVPVARMGQRWIVPSAPVRELLHLEEVA
ncbi:hypothetical protein [Mycobacteroides abscessus]|uniref:hypothetical protein n=1 Tax=Mycobacteroides abscessus TaxID=36809 RepID=UPI0019CF99AD|nr:hypothetical protein [Mycobacteroides abscessus]MBN7483728.1 hypothetical protein [Mycobacteroides abscessus subsp. massiliense]